MATNVERGREVRQRLQAAAIDGVMLHRALDPALGAQAVAPVLRRTVTP